MSSDLSFGAPVTVRVGTVIQGVSPLWVEVVPDEVTSIFLPVSDCGCLCYWTGLHGPLEKGSTVLTGPLRWATAAGDHTRSWQRPGGQSWSLPAPMGLVHHLE